MENLSFLEPIAVTGATGFIGRHLVRALVDRQCHPILLTRSVKDSEDLSDFGEELQWHETELTDVDSVRDSLKITRPATVFHLAGTRGRGEHDCMELNFTATVRLLEAGMAAGARRIVMMGTAEEYGNQPGRPLTESLPTLAASPYGISKAAATKQALAMHAQNGCAVVVMRPFSVYGPGQPRDMFVAEAIDSALRDVEFKMTRGEQKRDLVFVTDVVRGLIAAASAPGIEGRVINLGSGECHRLREVAELIWRLTDTKAPLLIGARVAHKEELSDTWADITLARRLLEWKPEVDLESGLRRTIDFARNQLGTKTKVCQVT